MVSSDAKFNFYIVTSSIDQCDLSIITFSECSFLSILHFRIVMLFNLKLPGIAPVRCVVKSVVIHIEFSLRVFLAEI